MFIILLRVAISATVSALTLFITLAMEHKIEDRSNMCAYSFVVGFIVAMLILVINFMF